MRNKMYTFMIKRKQDIVMCYLMKQKTGGWSYINITKKHICPCVFDTVEDALEDLKNQDDVISFKMWEN